MNKLKKFFNTYKQLEVLDQKIDRMSEMITMLHGDSFPNDKERQVETQLDKVRADHRARYQKASSYISPNDNVLDIACGIGYGSYMLAVDHSAAKITGVDISEKTIAFADKHYKRKNISYICDNCLSIELKSKSYDVIVSFETVEHIDADRDFIDKIHGALKDNGLFILSTPNEQYLPFSKDYFPYHIKHYTESSLSDLLDGCGFRIKEVFAQPDNSTSEVIEGWQGKFNIVVAEKKP